MGRHLVSLLLLFATGCAFDTGGLPGGDDDPGAASAEPGSGSATPLPPIAPEPPPADADAAVVDPPPPDPADAAPQGQPGASCTNDNDCATGVCRAIDNGPGGGDRVCLQRCGFGLPPCRQGSFCVGDGVCTL